jgi:hypothetical protein
MATLPAIRTSEIASTALARILARRYEDLLDCFYKGVLVDPDNLLDRVTSLENPLLEAVRRLKLKGR